MYNIPFLGAPQAFPVPIDPPGERPHAEVIPEVAAALQARWPNRYFSRGRSLLEVLNGETHVVSDLRLIDPLHKAATYVVSGKNEKRFSGVPAEDRKALIGSAETWAPALERVVRVPVLTPTGLVTTPGYSPAARIYLHWQGHGLPEALSQIDDAAATKLTSALLDGFAWASESDRTHAMGLLLLPILRPVISGPSSCPRSPARRRSER